jgi:hypothetical protein
MRIALLIVVALALVLSASAVWADWVPGTDTSTYVELSDPYYSGVTVYDPVAVDWGGGAGAIGDGSFSVVADIELYNELYFSATNVRFHIASDSGAMSAVIPGWNAGNNNEAIFITKDPAAGEEVDMRFLKQISSVYGPVNDPDISLTWEYRKSQRGSGVWTGWALCTWSTAGLGGKLVGVYFPVNASYWDFEIRVTINPAQHQSDGHYEMDPVVAASPIL